MYTINCMVRVPEEQIDLVKQDIAGLARFWAERAYGETMLATAANAAWCISNSAWQRRPPQRTSGEGAGRDARTFAG